MAATAAAEPSRRPAKHTFDIHRVSRCFSGAWNHTVSLFSVGLCAGARGAGQSRLKDEQSSPRASGRGLFTGRSRGSSKSEVKKGSPDVFRSESVDATASTMIQATFRGAKGREEVALTRTSSNKDGTATPDVLSGRSSINGASCMVQAAGHAKTFQRDPDNPATIVIKEGTANERENYEALQAEALRKFAPSYHGHIERGAITLLRLENMTAGCSTPCVMDLKLGTRSFVEAEANNSKKRTDLAQKIADLDVSALLPREVGADKWKLAATSAPTHQSTKAPKHQCTNVCQCMSTPTFSLLPLAVDRGRDQAALHAVPRLLLLLGDARLPRRGNARQRQLSQRVQAATDPRAARRRAALVRGRLRGAATQPVRPADRTAPRARGQRVVLAARLTQAWA